VAIRAADIALLDLRRHARPATRHHHVRHIPDLQSRVAVVEFQHDRIGTSAVHAGMRLQVAHDLTSILLAPAPDLSDRASDVIRLVRQVVATTVRGVAASTVEIERPAALAAERKAGGRLLEPAAGALQHSLSMSTHWADPPRGKSRIAPPS